VADDKSDKMVGGSGQGSKRTRRRKVIHLASVMTRETSMGPIERYRLSQKQRESWKRTSGCLTGKIPHGLDGETLSDYITRKRQEEKRKP
jgi:hypothetical protein